MATSFFYIYVMATSFFYIYIDIYIDIYFDIYIDIYITFTNWRSVQSFYWTPFFISYFALYSLEIYPLKQIISKISCQLIWKIQLHFFFLYLR